MRADRRVGQGSEALRTDWHVIVDTLHTCVTPLFKTLDFVATVHLREKLLVTQLIENFPKFMDRGS